jgi:DNA invertase Pin-like site-specific DNA recombinase
MSSKRVAIYTRVSTDDQTTANQDVALQVPASIYGWKVIKTYEDHAVSGSIPPMQRPGMRQLLQAVHTGKVDMIAVYEISRLGRNTLDVLNLANELKRYKVDLYIHTLNIDTSNPYGELIFTLMAALAQMEKKQTLVRIHAGIARAKLHGTKSGKPIGRPRADDTLITQIHALRAEGKGIHTIRKQLGCGVKLIQSVIQGNR